MNNRLYAIDWSHTKGLAIYDGKKLSVVDRKSLLKKLAGESNGFIKSSLPFNPASDGADGKSKATVQSIAQLTPSAPVIILEQGCPLSLIYDVLRTGCQVKTISNRATQDYRVEHNIEKSDETDTKLIYELANNGAKLTPVSLEDTQIQLVDLYQRYKRYQKARVAMVNMRKAYIRQFGDGESTLLVKSSSYLNPSPAGDDESIDRLESTRPINSSPALEGEGESSNNLQSRAGVNPSLSSLEDGEESTSPLQSSHRINFPSSDGTLPYDIGIDTLKVAENSCLKKIVKLAPPVPKGLTIRGLGPRLWAGIYITANPVNFPTLSSYLRYCGLVNLDQLDHKWNRHARMLYHLLADEVMRLRDEKFRPIYDQCKADIAGRYPEYTKAHIHNAALNRTATFLAKEIWRGGNYGKSKTV